MTLAFAGLLAGFVHVLSGPDHLAAIAPYAVKGQSSAWRTGVRWGLGHSAGVLGVGLLALALRHAIPLEALSVWGERCVGFVLVAIGIWGIRVALRRPEGDQHGHHHQAHVHGHAAIGVGTLHGLAGSSHLLGILPALALPSDFMAGTYLLLFGAGSVAGMGTFASIVGWVAGSPGARGSRTQAALLGLCAVFAVAVGGFWILSDLWFVPDPR